MTRKTNAFVACSGTLVLLFATGGCGPYIYPGQPPGPWQDCQEVLARGLFNEETLACFPDVEEPLRDALCASEFFGLSSSRLRYLGLGNEANILDLPLIYVYSSENTTAAGEATRAFDAGFEEWRHTYCLDRQATRPFYSEEARALWQKAYNYLPISLYGPWHNCTKPSSDKPTVDEFPEMGCILHGSYDTAGVNEAVAFQVDFGFRHWFHYYAVLTQDLYVEGADCSGKAWKKGKVFSTRRPHLLECRRLGGAEVVFELKTEHSGCRRSLRELREPPWQTLCGLGENVRLPTTPTQENR